MMQPEGIFMSRWYWVKALCLSLLVVIVMDIGFLVRVDSISKDACFYLAAMTAVGGLVPIGFATYLIRATRSPK